MVVNRDSDLNIKAKPGPGYVSDGMDLVAAFKCQMVIRNVRGVPVKVSRLGVLRMNDSTLGRYNFLR